MGHWTVLDSLGRPTYTGAEDDCQRFAEVYGGRVVPPGEDPAIGYEMATSDGLGGPRPGLQPEGRRSHGLQVLTGGSGQAPACPERDHSEDPRDRMEEGHR